MKAGAKSVYTGRAGNVRVPVYAYSGGRYCVAWREAGQRKRETFSAKARAAARADEIALAINNGQADVLQLSSADRDSYRLALRAAQRFGQPLHVAIAEWEAATEVLAGASMLEAVRFYRRECIDRLVAPPTLQIRDEMLAQLRDNNPSPQHERGLRNDLGHFAAAFPDLTKANEDAIRDYLRKLRNRLTKAPLSPRRRDNVRDAIVQLSRFARSRGYLPEEKVTAAERIEQIAEGGEVTTYDAATLSTLLEHVAYEWRPWMALAAFAGLRTSEIFRLQWSDLKWGHKAIAIRRSVARKVRVARLVPMSDNLCDWLGPWRDKVGPLFPHRSWRSLESKHGRVLAALKKATGIVWDNNALRHSFGSHRLALVKSIDQVALEMGNSPAKVRENYHDPKTEQEARDYFGLLPPEVRAANVLPLPLQFGA